MHPWFHGLSEPISHLSGDSTKKKHREKQKLCKLLLQQDRVDVNATGRILCPNSYASDDQGNLPLHYFVQHLNVNSKKSYEAYFSILSAMIQKGINNIYWSFSVE